MIVCRLFVRFRKLKYRKKFRKKVKITKEININKNIKVKKIVRKNIKNIKKAIK